MDRKTRTSLLAGAALLLVYLCLRGLRLAWVSETDWSVIAILALFLVATEGLRESGYLLRVIHLVSDRDLSNPALHAALVAASAALAAAVTNDVSLFVVVPLTLGVCQSREMDPVRLLVIETMAANAGSMAMPWGNPQNLYLFHHYHLRPGLFYHLMVPPALAMTAVLAALAARLAPRGRPGKVSREAIEVNHWQGIGFTLLLVVGTLHILRVLPVPTTVLAPVAIAFGALMQWRVLVRTDWSLLTLFAAIFIGVYGIQHSPAAAGVAAVLGWHSWLRTYFVTAGASQIVSNVPAALIASGVLPAHHAQAAAAIPAPVAALLLGVNVGGLGTPLASLANLIAARLFVHEGGQSRDFYRHYWKLNLAGLAVFLAIGLLTLFLFLSPG